MDKKEINDILQSERKLYLGTEKNRAKRWKKSHHIPFGGIYIISGAASTGVI